MKALATTLASLCFCASAQAQVAEHASTVRQEEVRSVAPALEKYTQERLLGEVWKRPGLAPRDRSIVTLAALIARTQTVEMPDYIARAL